MHPHRSLTAQTQVHHLQLPSHTLLQLTCQLSPHLQLTCRLPPQIQLTWVLVTLQFMMSPLPVLQMSQAPHIFSPSAIRPFPKAGPRKTTGRTRKRRQREILTDKPVKQALMEEEQRGGGRNTIKKILERIMESRRKGRKNLPKKSLKPTLKILRLQMTKTFVLSVWSHLATQSQRKCG